MAGPPILPFSPLRPRPVGSNSAASSMLQSRHTYGCSRLRFHTQSSDATLAPTRPLVAFGTIHILGQGCCGGHPQPTSHAPLGVRQGSAQSFPSQVVQPHPRVFAWRTRQQGVGSPAPSSNIARRYAVRSQTRRHSAGLPHAFRRRRSGTVATLTADFTADSVSPPPSLVAATADTGLDSDRPRTCALAAVGSPLNALCPT